MYFYTIANALDNACDTAGPVGTLAMGGIIAIALLALLALALLALRAAVAVATASAYRRGYADGELDTADETVGTYRQPSAWRKASAPVETIFDTAGNDSGFFTVQH